MQGFINFLQRIIRRKSIHLRHILQIGILMEERGRIFYDNLANRIAKAEAKRLCSKLAGDELRHRQLIEETLSHWLPFPIYPETLERLEEEMFVRNLFLNPPPLDSSEEDMVKYAIKQEKGCVDFYLSFEKTFPEAWKKLHIQRLVMEEKSHASDLIAAYPKFKDVVV